MPGLRIFGTVVGGGIFGAIVAQSLLIPNGFAEPVIWGWALLGMFLGGWLVYSQLKGQQ